MKYNQPWAVSDPNAPYVNADHANGITGSVPPAASMEEPQRELVNIVANSGQTPIDDDLEQVTRAIRGGTLNFRIDQGTANNMVVAQLSPPITEYEAGLELRVLVAHSCLAGSPTTIQVGDLAPATVKRLQGTNLQPNDVLAGQIADLVYDGNNFQLQNIGIADQAGNGNVDRYEITIPYVHDTGTANHLIGLYSPALPNINEGRTVEIKLANATTGPVDFKPNNFPVHPVAHPDGSAMFPGDGVVNQIWLLVFDGVEWQLISSRPTIFAAPKPKGRSLQFMDPTAGWYGTYPWGSVPCLTRRPTVAGNRKTWSWSAFVRFPVQIPKPWFYSSYQYDSREVFVSAGDAGASWGGCAGDVTCLGWEGGDIDTAMNTYIASTYGPRGGYGDPDTVSMGYNPSEHMGTYTVGILKDTRWHHLLWTCDSTIGESRIWLDGVEVTYGPVPANLVGPWNDVRGHAIGCETGCGSPAIGGIGSDGAPTWLGTRCRMAEIVHIDGAVLPWTAFAQNVGGVIVPKNPMSLTFGTNGYYLNFSDGSAMTSTTLGKDYSGNGNNYTPINMTASRIHDDYPGAQDNTETFGPYTNGGAWPNGLPPGWTSVNGPGH